MSNNYEKQPPVSNGDERLQPTNKPRIIEIPVKHVKTPESTSTTTPPNNNIFRDNSPYRANNNSNNINNNHYANSAEPGLFNRPSIFDRFEPFGKLFNY